MQIDPFTARELPQLEALQPTGWPDIVPEFKDYLSWEFCYPICIKDKNRVIAIATAIEYPTTAWLAHIIVDPEYRRKGYGQQLVQHLIKHLKNKGFKSILLIATVEGKPVYEKAGFKKMAEYTFFEKSTTKNDTLIDTNIQRFNKSYYQELLKLDFETTGENREKLLAYFLNEAYVYANQKDILGFYLPQLKEGPIIARNQEAGIELLKFKTLKKNKVVLPKDNIQAISWLTNHGFKNTYSKATKMILGDNISWKPNNFYSRSGGNFG